jgi:hypothetical protein
LKIDTERKRCSPVLHILFFLCDISDVGCPVTDLRKLNLRTKPGVEEVVAEHIKTHIHLTSMTIALPNNFFFMILRQSWPR